MRVIATAVCTYGGKRRKQGDVFDLASKDDLRPWMEKWDAKKAAEQSEPAEKAVPVASTMSEITKGRSKPDQ